MSGAVGTGAVKSAAVALQVRLIQDEAELAQARELVDGDLLSHALIHASFDAPALAAHARYRGAWVGGQLVGVAAEIEDVFRYRSVPLAVRLPGAAAALVQAATRPFRCLAPERTWSELERAGGERERTYVQLARMRRDALPEPDPQVKTLDDPDELRAFLGEGFSDPRLQLGPFVGLRDGSGQLVATAGVEFATPRLAQLAFVKTREESRRQGRARALVAELVRALETPHRVVVLLVQSDNEAAVALYSGLGFRGVRRLARFHFA